MFEVMFGEYAAWFTIPALLGSIFFILRLAVSFIGFDADVDADVDDLSDDSTETFKFISIQALLTFAMGFGWAGFGAYRGAALNITSSMLIGLVGGVAMVWLLARLLRMVRGLEVSGNISVDSALGLEGQVYTTVPPMGQGRGQVRLTIAQRHRIYNAISDAGELRPPMRVRVVRVNDDRSLTVQPA